MRNARWFEAFLLLGAVCVTGCSSPDSGTPLGTAGTAAAGPAGNGGSNTTAGSGGMSTSGGVAGVGTGGATGGSPGTGGSTGGSTAGGSTGGSSGNAGAGGMGGASGASGMSGTGAGGTAGGAPSTGCGRPAGLTSGRASIDVSGTMREYILHVPDNYDPNRPYRLIFGWHQLAGSAESIANRGFYGVEEPSAGQAILVAPEGLIVNDRNDRGWANTGGQDVAFYRAMLDRFNSELCIDRNRIFSTGFSYGAMFSFTLACTPDSLTRAIAPQAGSAFGGCGNGMQPVAVLAFVGVNDSLLSGHRQAVNTFVERNGCSEQPTEMSMSWCDGLNSQNQPCVCMDYQNCDAGYPVISCEYQAGHTFAPNSGDTIWEFFSQF
jgi:polyhydroxybutyrate depolymerase